MEVQEKEEREVSRKIFEKILSDNFQNSMTDIYLQTQETQQTQIWQNQREPYLGLPYLAWWISW